MRHLFLTITTLLLINIGYAQCYQKADSCFNEANVFFQAGNYKKAGELFFASAIHEQNCSPIRSEDLSFELSNAALCFSAIGDINQSKDIYNKAIYIFDSLDLKEYLISPRIELAKLYITENNNSEALKLLNNVVLYANTTQNMKLATNCLLLKTDLFISDNNEINFQSTIDSLNKLTSDTAFSTLSKIEYKKAQYYNRRSYIDSCISAFNKAIAYASKSHDSLFLADLQLEYAQFSMQHNKTIPLATIDSAIALFQAIKEYAGLASIINIKGAYLAMISENEAALNNYSTALNIYTEMQNLKGIASVHMNIGDLYKNKGNYTKALEYLQKAYDVYLSTEEYDLANLALSNIGSVFISQSKYDKAIECYNEALQASENLGNIKTKALILNNFGIVYTAWGQYDKALHKYKEALAIHKELGDIKEYATTLNNIGGIHELNGQYDNAIEKYKESLKIYSSINDKNKIATILNNSQQYWWNILFIIKI